jgi:hypothetical protein
MGERGAPTRKVKENTLTGGADWNWKSAANKHCPHCLYIYKLAGLSCRHQRKAERGDAKKRGLGAAVAGENKTAKKIPSFIRRLRAASL